jgi:saccharopine dehydrogenase-like NADP-dependent oxidoreductase
VKRVVVLGAGRVSSPCVGHLLGKPDIQVRVYDIVPANAARVVAGRPRGESLQLDASKPVGPAIREADVVINLLPAPLQLDVARACVEERKPLVSACYATEPIKALDKPAREAGILILMEMGLDPGIDHMSAVKFIREVEAEGGRVKGFFSWCGALPAPEANTNPFGYKLSWSPGDLVGTLRRPARFLKGGHVVSIQGDALLENYTLKEIEGLGWFEEYPNGDALGYAEIYGIPDAADLFRGTLRYPGWCETLRKMLHLRIHDDEPRDLSGLTFADLTRAMIGEPAGDLKAAVARRLGLDEYSTAMKRIEWLGLLSDRPIGRKRGSMRDVVLDLFLEKLGWSEGERDLVVMQHEYIVEYPCAGVTKRHTSLLVDYGVPGGDTSVARTTGLPVALAAEMILRGRLDLVGVHIPVHPRVYEPILADLASMGIVFRHGEKTLRGGPARRESAGGTRAPRGGG